MPDGGDRGTFARTFGDPPDVHADAPGRVNLIGEHTDYHGGFVLPTVLPQRTVVHLRRRADHVVRAASRAIGGEVREFVAGAEVAGKDWLDYVQGVTWVLARHGRPVPGADVLIESTLPLGAGVSSSAALEVSLLRALRAAFDLPLDDVQIARLAQQAENEFVGAAVGIMDQMACSIGRSGQALSLDTRSLAFEHVPLPDSVALVVVDSGIPHRHAGGSYATRRRESFAAAAALGVEQLREIGVDGLDRLARLPEGLQRRARHIVTENQRVLDAVAALRVADAKALGALFNASHASMRDDYEVSTPQIDTLVSLGQGDPDVYGARLTGGGFGGAVVMLARPGRAVAVATRVLDAYELRTNRRGRILVPAPAPGD